MKTQRSLAATLLLSFASATAVAADGGTADDASGALKANGVIRLRGKTIETRDVLYPGEPKLVGLDQSDAEYRKDLGIYRHAEHGPAVVDPDEHRERLLRIYSGQRVTTVPEPVTIATHRALRADSRAQEAVGSGGAWLGAALCVAAVALVGVRFSRRKIGSITPDRR